MPTLERLLRSGLLGDAQVLTGAAHLGRAVSWVVRLRARPPALPPLSGGELVLVSIAALLALDARPTLEQVVEHVAELSGAAVVVIGPVAGAAERVAERERLPLIQVSAVMRPQALELELQRWLAERKLQAQQELLALHQELTGLALTGGFPALLDRTVRVTNKPALLHSPDWLIRLRRQPRSDAIPAELVDAALAASGPAADRWARGLSRGGHEVPSALLPVPELQLVRLVAGVRDGAGIGAYLSLVGHTADVGQHDAGALVAAAGAGSIELVREHATMVARDAVDGDLLERLCGGEVADDETLGWRARRLGYDLTQPHLALAVRRADGALAGQPLRDALGSLSPDAPVLAGHHDHHLLALVPVPVPANGSLARVQSWHRGCRDQLGPTSAGLSGPVAGIAELGRALAEARQALDLGERLFGAGRLVSFTDLGIFTFLLRSQGPENLRTFHASVLGRLVEYDGARGAQLVATLEAYFASRCSQDAAAKRLHLHRNSLLYRLRRIEEITGARLDDPEARLLLHLALRVGQVLRLTRGERHGAADEKALPLAATSAGGT